MTVNNSAGVTLGVSLTSANLLGNLTVDAGVTVQAAGSLTLAGGSVGGSGKITILTGGFWQPETGASSPYGGDVLLPNELGIEVPAAYRYAVHVAAGITHTIGGVRIDRQARVLREDSTPIDGLYAAGADAGGIATGGYASGLASALVFGRIAEETAARA